MRRKRGLDIRNLRRKILEGQRGFSENFLLEFVAAADSVVVEENS